MKSQATNTKLQMCLFISFALLFFFITPTFAASTVIINEVQTGGKTSDDEFIELWNPTAESVNLEEWSLQYKTATGKTITKKNFEKGVRISPFGFYLIAQKEYTGKTKADMTQSAITLTEKGGNLFLVRNQEAIADASDPDIADRAVWGTGDSAVGNVAPAPSAGQSIERDVDGTFVVSSAPTPDNTSSTPQEILDSKTPTSPLSPSASSSPATSAPQPSPQSAPQSEKQNEKDPPAQKKTGNLRFSEIVPNAFGNAEEFIELENETNIAVDLFGWRIEDARGQEFLLADEKGKVTLEPNTFLALPRSKTNIALDNDEGVLKLFSPTRTTAVDSLRYRDALPGQSYARDMIDRFVWTTMPTPGAKNSIVNPNRAPVPIMHTPLSARVGEIITFDATDSFDADRDTLTYLWEFGDGKGTRADPRATYLYEHDGAYAVRLVVDDGKVKQRTEKTIVVGTPATTFVPAPVALGGVIQPPQQKKSVQAASTPPQIHPTPLPLQSQLGRVITIEGEVVESKGTSIIVATEEEEVKVAFTAKNKVKKPLVRPGEHLRVTGIVDKTASGYRLLPRSLQDVERQPLENVSETAGAQLANLPPRNPYRPMLPYIGMTLGTGILGATIVAMRRRIH